MTCKKVLVSLLVLSHREGISLSYVWYFKDNNPYRYYKD